MGINFHVNSTGFRFAFSVFESVFRARFYFELCSFLHGLLIIPPLFFSLSLCLSPPPHVMLSSLHLTLHPFPTNCRNWSKLLKRSLSRTWSRKSSRGGGGGASAGDGGENLPKPSFWMFVVVFSHKSGLSELEKLRLIKTDVGKCRAWIRVALNQGHLSGYLTAMKDDVKTCARHFHAGALMRDQETMEVLIAFIKGEQKIKLRLMTISKSAELSFLQDERLFLDKIRHFLRALLLVPEGIYIFFFAREGCPRV